MVALRTLPDEGVQRGVRYHAHLFDGGILVNVPTGGKPYVAQPFDFARVVEDHHEFNIQDPVNIPTGPLTLVKSR